MQNVLPPFPLREAIFYPSPAQIVYLNKEYQQKWQIGGKDISTPSRDGV